MMPLFSIDERSIIQLYRRMGFNREGVLMDLTACQRYITEPNISKLIDALLPKLSTISDEYFDELDLVDTLAAATT